MTTVNENGRLERVNRELKAVKRRAAEDRWAAQLSGTRWQAATWATVGDRPGVDLEAVRQLAAWVECPDRNVLLVGPVGVGKTHLALAALGEVVARHGRSVRWSTAKAWADSCRAMAAGGPDPLPAWKKAEVAFLDDVTIVRCTDFVAEQLWDLVDARYSHEGPMPTVITANVSPDADIRRALGESLGPPVVDRLGEGALVVRMVGRSLRLRHGNGGS